MVIQRKLTWIIVMVLVLAFALTSCGGGAAPAAQPSGGTAPAAGSSGGGAAGGQVVITPDMAGKTIDMKVGQELLSKLGSEGNCKADVTPSFLLNEVTDAKLNPGEQGLWKATMNGAATFQATCDNSKQYNVNIKISAAQ